MITLLPVQPLPAQTFGAVLGEQECTITLRQLSTGLFLDLEILPALIVSCRYCPDRVNLVRYAYLGFAGYLYFVDTTNKGEDPSYEGLGSRYVLTYEN